MKTKIKFTEIEPKSIAMLKRLLPRGEDSTCNAFKDWFDNYRWEIEMSKYIPSPWHSYKKYQQYQDGYRLDEDYRTRGKNFALKQLWEHFKEKIEELHQWQKNYEDPKCYVPCPDTTEKELMREEITKWYYFAKGQVLAMEQVKKAFEEMIG